jgi:hypothetical protein
MLKAATAFADKGGIVEGRIAFMVHDGKFEVLALSCDGPMAELHQWVDAQSGYNDDFECVHPVEEGACTVKIKDLPRLKNTPDDIRALFDAQNDTLVITVGDYAFHMNASNTVYDGYVCAKPEGDSEITLQFSPQDSAAFAFVAPAMAPSEFLRDEFMGIHIQDGRAVATDGHRLHICPMTTPDASLIGTLSAKLANFLAGRLQFPGTLTEYRKSQEIKVPKGGGKFKTETETTAAWHVYEHEGGVNIRLVSRPVKGLFPDFNRVFPSYRSDEVREIDTEQWTSTIKQLSAGWKSSNVLISNRPADRAVDKCIELRCARIPGEKEKEREKVEPPRIKTIPMGHIPNLPVCLNSKYILDALKNCKNSVATFCCIDNNSPVWIGEWSPVEFGRGAIIMPMDF